MTTIADRIASLSPQKRQLLRQQLGQAGNSRRLLDGSPAQGPVVGTAPVTPRQQYLFPLRGAWNGDLHFNVSALLEVTRRLDPDLTRQAAQHLMTHHDALRVRLLLEDGTYFHRFLPPDDPVPFTFFDLSAFASDCQRAIIEEECARLQPTLNLFNGPMLQVALFDLGENKPQRLLFIVSHTICDYFSLRILREDFVRTYEQMSQGEQMSLPVKTTSLKEWLELREAYAHTAPFQHELRYWRSLPWGEVGKIPLDNPLARERNTREHLTSVSLRFSEEETRLLLKVLRMPGMIAMRDLVLSTFLQTCAEFSQSPVLSLFVVDNARATGFLGADLSRTVGNIASMPKGVFDLRGATTPRAMLGTVAEQLARLPNRGAMWEWLPVDMTLKSELAFNYLGHDARHSSTPGGWLRRADENMGPRVELREEHWALLACWSRIAGERLWVDWVYNQQLYHESTIARLAERQRQFIRATARALEG